MDGNQIPINDRGTKFPADLRSMKTYQNVHPLKRPSARVISPVQPPTAKYSDRLLRLHEVIYITGLSKTSIYTRGQKGTFPMPVSIGERAVAWRESEVNTWMQSLPAAATMQASGGHAK